MKKTNSRLSAFLKSDKGIKIVMAVGILIILLIFISSLYKREEKPQDTASSASDITVTTDEYVTQLETKVSDIISSIEGVGNVKIMVTLENGIENIYAQEEKQNKDVTQTDNTSAVSQRDNLETKTIIIQDKDGNKTALLKTQLEPTVKGVVIVCDGGDDILVQQNVTEAVTTALNIKSTRVCVVKKTK